MDANIDLTDDELYLSGTPGFIKIMEEIFLVEMLQGERWEADGLIHYKMKISIQKKKQLIKWYIEHFAKTEKN